MINDQCFYGAVSLFNIQRLKCSVYLDLTKFMYQNYILLLKNKITDNWISKKKIYHLTIKSLIYWLIIFGLEECPKMLLRFNIDKLNDGFTDINSNRKILYKFANSYFKISPP